MFPLLDGAAIDVEGNSNIILQFGGRYLRIVDTTLEDVGDYSCIAQNDAGSALLDFHLDVYGK